MSKVYVVTGATSGIGNALVKALARENKVFAGYRDKEKLSCLENISVNVIPFFIDMTDKKSLDEAASFISFQVEKIDTLINVAGCVVAGAMECLDIDRLEEQFSVNTFSHLRFTQKLMSKLDGGKIINISSMASYGIFPFIAPYCASKRALDILFNAMQIEMKNAIKVVSIKPGVIATPLWGKSIANNSNLKEDEKYFAEYNYLVKNAEKNEKTGLSVEDVVKVVLKADKARNPKATYCVGIDSIFAAIISRLPSSLLKKIVSFGLSVKVSNNSIKG